MDWSIYWNSKAKSIVIVGIIMGIAFSVIVIPGFDWVWTPVITASCPVALIVWDIILSW